MTWRAGAAETPVPTQALVLLASLSLFWGVNFPMIKLAVTDIDPWTFRTICLGVGGVGLLAIHRLAGGSLAVPRRQIGVLIGCSLLNITGWQLSIAFGLSLMEAGRGVIIAYTMPIWASLLAVALLGERFTQRRAFGLGLAVVGLLLLVLPDLDGLLADPAGPALVLLAAVSWGAGTVATKSVDWHMPVAQLTGTMLLIGGVPVVIGMAVLGEPATLAAAGPASLVGLAYSATIPMVFCHYAWFKTVRLLPANLAAIGTVAIPVVGVLTSALILGERVGWAEVAALLAVAAALALVLVQPATAGSRPR